MRSLIILMLFAIQMAFGQRINPKSDYATRSNVPVLKYEEDTEVLSVGVERYQVIGPLTGTITGTFDVSVSDLGSSGPRGIAVRDGRMSLRQPSACWPEIPPTIESPPMTHYLVNGWIDLSENNPQWTVQGFEGNGNRFNWYRIDIPGHGSFYGQHATSFGNYATLYAIHPTSDITQDLPRQHMNIGGDVFDNSLDACINGILDTTYYHNGCGGSSGAEIGDRVFTGRNTLEYVPNGWRTYGSDGGISILNIENGVIIEKLLCRDFTVGRNRRLGSRQASSCTELTTGGRSIAERSYWYTGSGPRVNTVLYENNYDNTTVGAGWIHMWLDNGNRRIQTSEYRLVETNGQGVITQIYRGDPRFNCN